MLRVAIEEHGIAEEILEDGRVQPGEDEYEREGGHRGLEVHFEHGQWWLSCKPCGAVWSPVEWENEKGEEGWDFEEVSRGDESCLGKEA